MSQLLTPDRVAARKEDTFDDFLTSTFDSLLDESLKTSQTTPSGLILSEDEDWVEKPVDMEEFVLSKEYLNCQTVYPKILEILWEIDKPEIREAYLALGKGSGKSFISSIMIARMIYKLLCLRNPQLYFGKAPGSQILTLNLSVSADQAKEVIFGNFQNLIKPSPWFQDKYHERSRSIEFPHNIFAFSGHSKSTSWLGYNTILGILDEASWHVDTSDRSVADELYAALIGSCKTRFPWAYKMIIISSVKEYDDFLLSRIDFVKDNGDEIEIGKDMPHRFNLPTRYTDRKNIEAVHRGF